MTKVEVGVGKTRIALTAGEALRIADELGRLGTLASTAIASEIERAAAAASIVRTPDDPVDALLLLRAVDHLRNFAPAAPDRGVATAGEESEPTAGLSDLGKQLIAKLGASDIVYEIELPEGGVSVFWSRSGPYWTSDRLVASRRAWRVTSATQPKEGTRGRLVVEAWVDRPPS